MHATVWNNAPRSVQLIARNCKCSKWLNNVPRVVRSCIKYGIANHTPRWNHSCIKMHATIWNNAPRSVQLVVRNRRKDDWQNYSETKVVMRCGGSWTHNTAIARWLTISLHNAPYIPAKIKSKALWTQQGKWSSYFLRYTINLNKLPVFMFDLIIYCRLHGMR